MVMIVNTVEMILVLSRRWKVPARDGDVPNAYVRSEKEKDVEIYMSVPSRMQVGQDILKQSGVAHTKELIFLL